MSAQPPIAPDVDLRDFAFMPLDVRRLRDSRLVAVSTDEEFKAWVMLLCASWHQVPAGSLPNDDIELGLLAGLGRVSKDWLRVKKGALYGWTLYSDGRFYHPIVVAKAIEAWAGKLLHHYKRECDRLRKENRKRQEAGEVSVGIPTFGAWKESRNSAGKDLEFQTLSDGIPAETENFPMEIPNLSDGQSAEIVLIGTGTGTVGREEASQEGGIGRVGRETPPRTHVSTGAHAREGVPHG